MTSGNVCVACGGPVYGRFNRDVPLCPRCDWVLTNDDYLRGAVRHWLNGGPLSAGQLQLLVGFVQRRAREARTR